MCIAFHFSSHTIEYCPTTRPGVYTIFIDGAKQPTHAAHNPNKSNAIGVLKHFAEKKSF